MHLALVALLLGAAFVGAPLALDTAGVAGPLGLVAASVGLALVLAGRASPLPLCLGALGGLGVVALGPGVPWVAGALLGTALHGARALRAPTGMARGVAFGLAALGGALAAAVSAAYGGSPDGVVRVAAVVVAGVVALGARMVPAEHPQTFALKCAAAGVGPTLSGTLTEAASLHAQTFGSGLLGRMDPTTRSRVEAAWDAFVEAAGRRVEMERGGVPAGTRAWVDTRMVEGVEALRRVHDAAAESNARQVGGLDTAVRVAVQEGEALEAEAQAWREIARIDARA